MHKLNIGLIVAVVILVILNVFQFSWWRKMNDKISATYSAEIANLEKTISAYGTEVDVYTVVDAVKSGDEITETNLIYISMDDIEALVNGTSETGTIELNVKDVVKVHVEEVAMSPGNRMLWTLLRVDKGRFEFSLAGTVR